MLTLILFGVGATVLVFGIIAIAVGVYAIYKNMHRHKPELISGETAYPEADFGT